MNKKVLIYRNKLLPYSETFIKAQAEALKGWDYHYLTNRVLDELPIDPYKVIVLPKLARKKGLNILSWFKTLKRQIVIRRIKSMAFDLIHAHFGTDAVKLNDLQQALDIPMIVTLHGFDITIYKEVWESGAQGKHRTNYPNMLRLLSQNPKVSFIAVSHAIKSMAVQFGIPEDKVQVAYIGVDMLQFQPKASPVCSRIITYVGRMVEKKGASILIHAFAKIKEQRPDAVLCMIGNGKELSKNRALAAELNVPVQFLGVKSSAEVTALLQKSRIFCLPSITAKNGDAEGLGLVIVEAQACGIPVVTSAKGGATEAIIHGETGFYFPEKDIDMLAELLLKLLNDDALVSRFSDAAVEFSRKNFDLISCTEQLERLYDVAIESA